MPVFSIILRETSNLTNTIIQYAQKDRLNKYTLLNNSMKQAQLEKRFYALRESISESITETKIQIDCIEKNAYIGGIITLALGLGVTYVFNILVYWIPACFILIYFWGLKGGRKTGESLNLKKTQKLIDDSKKLNAKMADQGLVWIIKLFIPYLNSLAIIFGISFFILLSISLGFIKTSSVIDPIIPMLACLLYMPTPFLINRFTKIFKFQEMITQVEKVKTKYGHSGLKLLLFAISIIIIPTYLLLVVFLPLYSFFLMMPLIENWFILCLVLIVQIILLVFMTAYFYSLITKKELTNTLTQLIMLRHLVSRDIINGTISEKKLKEGTNALYDIKKYDLMIDDSFKIVNNYYLTLNPAFVKQTNTSKNNNGKELNKALKKEN